MLSRRLIIELEATADASTVSRREEGGCIGKVMHHEEGEKAEENGSEALDYKDPCPAWAPAFAVKIVDCGCEETTEGAGKSGGREENSLEDYLAK